MISCEEPKVNDLGLLTKDYFDLPAGVLMKVIRVEGTMFSTRPVLVRGQYDMHGYFFFKQNGVGIELITRGGDDAQEG